MLSGRAVVMVMVAVGVAGALPRDEELREALSHFVENHKPVEDEWRYGMGARSGGGPVPRPRPSPPPRTAPP